MADQTLSVIIEMIARGDGAKVSADQINTLKRASLELSEAGQKAHDSLTNLGHAPSPFAAAANEARASTRAVDEYAHELDGLANAGSGLVAGGAAGVAMALIGTITAAVIEQFKELDEKLEATVELSRVLQQNQQFNPKYLGDLVSVAEHLADADHKTKDWIGTFKELVAAGADEKGLPRMALHVKELAKLLGGDLKEATKTATRELEGNYDGLRQIGIVIDDLLTPTQALAEAQHQVALRTAQFGNAAASSAADVAELKEASHNAATAITEIKREADAATTALKGMIGQMDRAQAARQRALGHEEAADITTIRADVAEGKKTPEQGDAAVAALKKKNAQAKFDLEKETAQKKIAEYQNAIDTEQSGAHGEQGEGITGRAAQIKELEDNIAALRAVQEAKAFVNQAQNQKPPSQVYQNPELAAQFLEQKKEQVEFAQELLRGAQAKLQPGHDNLGAEQEALNKLRDEFRKADEAAYKRINGYLEAVQQVEAQLREGQATFEQSVRKSAAEGRGRVAVDRKKAEEAEKREQAKLEREFEKWQKEADHNTKRGLPFPEVPKNLQPFIKNGVLDFHNQIPAAPPAPPPFREPPLPPGMQRDWMDNNAKIRNQEMQTPREHFDPEREILESANRFGSKSNNLGEKLVAAYGDLAREVDQINAGLAEQRTQRTYQRG